MEGNGYIKLHRQIMENEFYFAEKFTKAQAWIDLLLLANHKPATVFIRGIEIKLNSGDLCYSQLTLSKRWKWNFKTVKKFLDMLKYRNMIEFAGGKISTVISIINWSNYQKNGEQNQPIKSISKATFFDAEGEQLGEQKENNLETNKNDKNVKNINGQWFESFYDDYPKKKAKKEAERIFSKKCKDEKIFTEIMTALKYQRESEQWKKDNGQFIPHPATWLNQERWKDEIEQPNKPTLDLDSR